MSVSSDCSRFSRSISFQLTRTQLCSATVHVLCNVCVFQVDDVFTPSLATLADVANVAYTRFRGDTVNYTTPIFLGQSHKIWGLTAIILHEVLRAIIPEMYNIKFSLSRF